MAGLVEDAVRVAAVGDPQVRGRHLHVGRERPHVQVVDVDDAVDGGELDGDGVEVEPGRRRLHDDAQRPPRQPERPRQDPHADGDGDGRVDPPPAGDRR